MSCLLLSFILIIHTQINICASNTINTDISSEYKDDIINCNSGEDCVVKCDENQACYNTNIYCPSGYSCDIQCISSYSRPLVEPLISNVCAYSTVHCTDSTQCDINCTDVNRDSTAGKACAYATFNWPSNKQYNLYCGRGAPCTGITVNPKYNNEPFQWSCDVDAACKSMTFNCPTNNTCDITCHNMEACRFMILNCDTMGTYPCSVSCDGYTACGDSVINGIGSVIGCSYALACIGLTFPEPPSDIDYTLQCTENASCQEAMIKCPTDAECHVICTGTNSCENAQIIWPTNGAYATSLTCLDDNACLNVESSRRPTIDPTSVGTIELTSVASIDPTSDPISRTEHSTSNPPFIATVDPTSDVTSTETTSQHMLSTVHQDTKQETERDAEVIDVIETTVDNISINVIESKSRNKRDITLHTTIIGLIIASAIMVFVIVVIICVSALRKQIGIYDKTVQNVENNRVERIDNDNKPVIHNEAKGSNIVNICERSVSNHGQNVTLGAMKQDKIAMGQISTNGFGDIVFRAAIYDKQAVDLAIVDANNEIQNEGIVEVDDGGFTRKYDNEGVMMR